MDPTTYIGCVYPWQCDHMGHMNVMWYTGKFDEATWTLFARIGLTPSYIRTEIRGMAAVQQNITYQREVLAGDIIMIRSQVTEMSARSLRFKHEMVNSETGETLAICDMTGVHMDRAKRKAIPFPEEIHQRVQAIAGGDSSG